MSYVPGTWANSVDLAEEVVYMDLTDLDRRLSAWTPDTEDFKPQQFAMGLRANKAEFRKVESLITSNFNKNHLWNCESEESFGNETANDEGREILKSVSNQLHEDFPETPWMWIYSWVHAIFIVMWREGRAKGIREGQLSAVDRPSLSGKMPNPRAWLGNIFKSSPPIIADNGYLRPTSIAVTDRSTQTPNLEHVRFSIEGYTSDNEKLFDKVEISSPQCVDRGRNPNQVESYLLARLIEQVELMVNGMKPVKAIKLRHGCLSYRNSSGLCTDIQQQIDFENVINQSLTTAPGVVLELRFERGTSAPLRKNLEAKKDHQHITTDMAIPRSQTDRSTPSPREFESAGAGSSKSSSLQLVKQPSTRARSYTNSEPSQFEASPKRNSIISRGIQNILPGKKKPVARSEERHRRTSETTQSRRPTPPAGTNAVLSAIKRAVHVKPQTSLKAQKVDRFESHQKRFEGLFKVEEITRFAKGGVDDLGQAAEIAENQRDNPDEDEVADAEDDDEDEEPAEYMVNRLQDILNNLDLTQLDACGGDSPWNICCQLFGIDPSKTGLDGTVSVFGLTKPLYQYQAFAVYWQMTNSRKLGGGFIADDPGLGKTLTFLAYIVVERQLSWLWNDVIDSREKKDGRHLQIWEHGSHDQCPSAVEFHAWIACPCRSSSPTSKMPAKPGVRLAIVPDNLVDSWRKSFLQYVRTDTKLEMRLVIASPANNPVRGDGWVVTDARHASNEKALKSKRTKLPENLKYDDDAPQQHQERCLVVTTAFDFKTWAKDFQYKATYKSYDKSGAETWIAGKNPGIVVGIAMIDECHEAGHYQKGMGRSSVLADLPQVNQSYLWGYSGTPFSTSPRTLEGVLWAIESHFPKKKVGSKSTGWEESSSYLPFSHKEFDKICTSFQNLNQPLGNASNKFKQDAKTFFDSFAYIVQAFMLRRTAGTSWFGRPLLALKPHLHSDIRLGSDLKHGHFTSQLELLSEVVSDELADKLKEVQLRWQDRDTEYKTTHPVPQSLGFNTQCKVQWRLRIIATFPYLVKLADTAHNDHLDFTVAELMKLIGPREKESPYYRHLKDIVESSPKAMWLYKFILDLMQRKDVNGHEQKLVIVTNFSPVALILKMFIEKFVRGTSGRVGAIYAGIKQRQRTAIIESFTDAIDEKGNRKQRTDFQFLIGTTRFLSTGLQLTRACNIVLMEPDFEFSRETQTYARVHRIGQQNPQTFSYRLIMQEDHVERQILERQILRSEFPGKLVTSFEAFGVTSEALDGIDVIAAQENRDIEDLLEVEQSTSRNMGNDIPLPILGELLQSHRLSRNRTDKQPAATKKAPGVPRLPNTLRPSTPSTSPVINTRSNTSHSRVQDDEGQRNPVPRRSSSLAFAVRHAVQAGPSRTGDQVRGGSTVRGRSVGRSGVSTRNLGPDGSSPTPRAGTSKIRGHSVDRGRSMNRGGAIWNPGTNHQISNPQVPILGSSNKDKTGAVQTLRSRPPRPPPSMQSVSLTGNVGSRRTIEVTARLGAITPRRPTVTRTPLSAASSSLTESVRVFSPAAGSYEDSISLTTSPGQASIRGLARASSEALPTALSPRISQQPNSIDYKIASDTENSDLYWSSTAPVPDESLSGIHSEPSPQTLLRTLAGGTYMGQDDDDVSDEIIESILHAQFPDPPTAAGETDSGESFYRARDSFDIFGGEISPRTIISPAMDTRSQLADDTQRVYAEIRDPPEWPLGRDSPAVFEGSTDTHFRDAESSTPVLRRVGGLKDRSENDLISRNAASEGYVEERDDELSLVDVSLE